MYVVTFPPSVKSEYYRIPWVSDALRHRLHVYNLSWIYFCRAEARATVLYPLEKLLRLWIDLAEKKRSNVLAA